MIIYYSKPVYYDFSNRLDSEQCDYTGTPEVLQSCNLEVIMNVSGQNELKVQIPVNSVFYRYTLKVGCKHLFSKSNLTYLQNAFMQFCMLGMN